jgi:chemotaxis signal transduction protein
MSVNRLLIFECEDRSYALRLDEVAALDQLGPLRVIPGTSNEVLGLASRRGRVVTVVDASRLLGADPIREGVLVLLERPFDRTAFYVPSPVRVRTLADDGGDEGDPAPSGGLHVLEARRLVDAVRARNTGRPSHDVLEGEKISGASTDSSWI